MRTVVLLIGLAIVWGAKTGLDKPAIALRNSPDTTLVQYGDTIVLRRGLDTISLKLPVPANFPPGKYWWHLHGPNSVIKLPYRGVVIVK